jgi:hypothetical protein
MTNTEYINLKNKNSRFCSIFDYNIITLYKNIAAFLVQFNLVIFFPDLETCYHNLTKKASIIEIYVQKSFKL